MKYNWKSLKHIFLINVISAALALALFLLLAPVFSAADAGAAEKLKICATITDLGNIAAQIGGELVEVTTFAKGTEDPHFIEARPGFIKELSRADMVLSNGMELEIGWLPLLLQNCRNARVIAGAPGNIDCSQAITAVDVPSGSVDRSMGDIHSEGNPHYLCDPINGIKVAMLIKEKFCEALPDKKDIFEKNYADFSRKIGEALVGEKLAKKYDVEKLMLLYENKKLKQFLESQREFNDLGGAAKKMLAYQGTKIVDDHNMWPYFLKRYGLSCAGHMEAIAGVPPTTKNIGELAEKMKLEHIKIILTSAYYDSKHAEMLSRETGAEIVRTANLTGSRPGAGSYIKMCEYNIDALVSALSKTGLKTGK